MNRRVFTTASLASLAAPVFAQTPTPSLRAAIIGHTGQGNYGHGLDTVWLKLPEASIVGVADADAAGLAAELKKLKLSDPALGFADYREMLAKVKPEYVAIGPRMIHEHRDMILACIAAGVRGIYVEKPLCRSLAEADEIIAAADKAGARVAIAHRNRYHPVLPVVAHLVKDGAIGRLLEVRARGKEDARGGSLDLWVLGSHLINLGIYFCGEPVACTASVFVKGKPATKADVQEGGEGIGPLAGDEVHARFEMANGLPFYFDSIHDAGSRTAGFGIQLIGTEGVIDMRADLEPLAHILQGSPFKPTDKARAWLPISTAGIGKPEPIANLKTLVMDHSLALRDLFTAVKEKREPLCSARDVRTGLEMISGVFESHRLSGARVTLPLTQRDNPTSRW